MNLQNSLEMRVVDEAIILAELALQGSACPVAVTDLQIFLYFFFFCSNHFSHQHIDSTDNSLLMAIH